MNQSVKDLIKDLSNRYDAIGRDNDSVTCDLLLQAEAMIEGLAQEVAAERKRSTELRTQLGNARSESDRRLGQALAAQQEVRSLNDRLSAAARTRAEIQVSLDKAQEVAFEKIDQLRVAQEEVQSLKAEQTKAAVVLDRRLHQLIDAQKLNQKIKAISEKLDHKLTHLG